MMNKKGFTLIEVVLAITILSTLTVLIAISSSRALKSKRKIQAEVEAVAALRDTMRVVRNDINQAYNHYDFELDIKDQAKKTTTTGVAAGASLKNPTTPAANPVVNNTPTTPSIRKSPATQFVGTENTLNFVTMNNGRMTANDIQADFVEVGYFLQNCKSFATDKGGTEKKSQGTQCLFRRVQKVIDKDVTKGGDDTVLLEDVTEFALKYLVEDKLDWLKEWKADKARYNVFPDAIEVTLGIEKEFDGKSRKYSIQYVVPIHFPNNVKAPAGSQPAGTTTVEEGVTQ